MVGVSGKCGTMRVGALSRGKNIYYRSQRCELGKRMSLPIMKVFHKILSVDHRHQYLQGMWQAYEFLVSL